MSPMEHERLIMSFMSRFRPQIDDEWGPHLPNVRIAGYLPELALAYSVASLADSLELAQEGLGKSLLTKFADEPEGICPPYWPPIPWPPHGGGGGPTPGEEEPIDKRLLGASLVYVSEILGNKDLAEIAATSGESMLG